MSLIKVLVGTRKGAFIITSDASRKSWEIADPLFPGWEVYHLVASPVMPGRLYASQSTQWFGQLIQRSDNGGISWQAMNNKFVYEGDIGTHRWHWGDCSPHVWQFERIWHLQPSPIDPEVIYAGAADAALFCSVDGGQQWTELDAIRKHESASHWEPGAGGLCLHTIVLPPDNPNQIFVGISAAGFFKSDDGGTTWRLSNKGLRSFELPDPYAEVGHCVHHVAMHPSRPQVLYLQKHWDVMRSDDAGDSWNEITGNLPNGFGFPIQVHAHEPDTVYIVPISGESEHFPPGGKLLVYRSRTGGGEWEPLGRGLPQRDCYVNIFREAMAVDSLEPCGVYFGTTGGQVYASGDEGDNWSVIARDLPAVLSVEVQVLP